MQLYNGLTIATNKVTPEEQRGVPHHLLGCIGLEEDTWRVGVWQREASRIIKEIRSRGKIPVVVGGTHYYLHSLISEHGHSLLRENDDDLNSGEEKEEPSNKEIIARFPILEEETEIMFQKLKEVDPIMAERWHPKDRRHIRRSLEYWLLNGRMASQAYAEQKESRNLRIKELPVEEDAEFGVERSPNTNTLLFWVHAEDGILKQRLNARVDQMVKMGLMNEVKSMDSFLQVKAEAGIAIDKTRGVWVSIAFKEFEPYLELLKSGEATNKELDASLKSCVEITQGATRRYAKAQLRYIRLQILPHLAELKALDNLYLLDSSYVSRFDQDVSGPAAEITTDFLAGRPRRHPHELSLLAKQFLEKKERKPDVWFRKTCEVCNMMLVTDIQWETHVKSRRHRALVAKKMKNEEHARYLAKIGETSGADMSGDSSDYMNALLQSD